MQQLGPRDVELRPSGQPGAEGIEDRQAGGGTFGHGDGDGPVRLGHRSGLVPRQLAVQRGDLPPVSVWLGVARGDRGVQLVRAGAAGLERPFQQGGALGNLGRVPSAAVLVAEQDELTRVAGSGLPARVGEQQQRQQARDLRLVRHERRERAGEPDRLLTQRASHQVGAIRCQVTLGEDQVDGPEHRRQASRQVFTARRFQPYSGLADLALGPDQALRHRRLRDDEGGGDLRRGQAAHAAQGQRDTRLRIERGMAAHEDERELLVAQLFLAGSIILRTRPAPRRRGLQRRPPGFAAQQVERFVPRHADEPAAGAGRYPLGGPFRQGERARVLHRVLGRLQVTREPGEDGDRRPPAVAEQLAVLVAQPGT